ncbi:MAG: hypothetical protein HY259_03480, partial [Chloroflexi bacterium]|nr:hypothetical protein [Chloroflexota bacterium]
DNPTFKLPASEMLTAGDASLLAYLKDEATLPRVLEALKDVPAWEAIVTRSAMKLLHMASADADRVPSFVLFARPDVAYATYSDPNRLGGGKALQPNPRYLWNHGTLAPEITTVWLAMVGPGVQAGEFPLWADHTDIRPTIHHLMNLPPVTEPDGRVLFEALTASALPAPLNAAKADLSKLADAYKQINAPLGRLGQAALKVSTRSALAATKPEGRQLDSLLLKTAADRDAQTGHLPLVP